ncbi:MAG: hypothetical protein K8I82_11375, partial [Anaerolineae bacterium]|nr:hypothetical protein [Anaerolineae bacterium]
MFDRSIPNNPNTQSPRFIHSIRGQFVLAFVLAVIIPAFIITTLTGVLGIQSGLNKASDQLNAITTLQEVRIGLYVDDLRNEVSRLTEDPAFLLLVRQALPNSLFPTRRDDARNQILAVFGTQLERSTLYTSLFVASLDGGVFVSSRDADVDRTFSDLSYFQSVPQGDYVLPPLYSSN